MEQLPALKLEKQISTTVTSCHNIESSIIHAPIHKVWQELKTLNFSKMIPSVFSKVEAEHGVIRVGDTVKVHYKDNTIWTLRILELSELNHFISWEVVEANPSISVTSIVNTVRLCRVTDDNTTFLQWETEFSNDANVGVIQDNKYKKLDYFTHFKAYFKA